MATIEETGVQNNDEGPHEQKKPCNANYTAMEDVMVTMAHFKASEEWCQTERTHFQIQN